MISCRKDNQQHITDNDIIEVTDYLKYLAIQLQKKELIVYRQFYKFYISRFVE